MGAGDGAATVRAAQNDPGALAIALDASVDALARGSATARRRGLQNALFVVSAIEALPQQLDGVAHAVTVNFPWGSLLRGIASGHEAVIGPLARLARPGASIRVLLSVEARDRLAGVPAVDAASLARNAAAYAQAGLAVLSCGPASDAELRASASSWAKRLAAGRSRAVIALTFRRDQVA